jgi:REP element-mobilizing transposase RayT
MGENYCNRIQEGNIHSYFRGNNRKIVFYSDEDKIELLKRCNKFAKQYQTTILEFVLMDNHVHLQVDTKNISGFMKSLQMSYTQWYNRRYNLSDKLFKTPFNSACKFSEDWIIDSMLYILKNPIKANICQNPGDHQWNSFGFHFNGDSPLREFIDVDTTLMDKHFKTKDNLEKAIMEYTRGNPAIMIMDYDAEDEDDGAESADGDSNDDKQKSNGKRVQKEDSKIIIEGWTDSNGGRASERDEAGDPEGKVARDGDDKETSGSGSSVARDGDEKETIGSGSSVARDGDDGKRPDDMKKGEKEEKKEPKRKSKRSTAKMRNQSGSFFEGMSTSLLCEYTNQILNGKSIFMLNRDELEKLIVKLFTETNASFRQLAALTNLNYDYVRKICGCGKGSRDW